MYGVYMFVFLPIVKIYLHRVQTVDTSIFQNGSAVCPTYLWQLSWLLTIPNHLWVFRDTVSFYGEDLLEPCPNPKLENHTLSGVFGW